MIALVLAILGLVLAGIAYWRVEALWAALRAGEREGCDGEDDAPASVTLTGPSGPIDVVLDDEAIALIQRLTHRRLEMFKLALDAEITDLDRRLEVPTEQRQCQ